MDKTSEIQLLEKENKLLKLELEYIHSAFDQFVYIVSHDLNAQFRGISNLSNWICEELPDGCSPEVREYKGMLHDKIEKTKNMLKAISEISKISSSQEKKESFCPVEEIKGVIKGFVSVPAIDIETTSGSQHVIGQRSLFRKVFLELLENALKFANPTTPIVRLKILEEDGSAKITVEDNGNGIPENERKKVFLLFYPPDTKNGSVGAGLTMVSQILRANSGKCAISDSDLGGCQFTVWWPTEGKLES